MSTIDPTQNNLNVANATQSASSAASASSPQLGQQQFLSLMVAQLKNQDPMQPMQNGEFLGQMAQFGTVSGIQDLQKSFGSLATALQSNQALMASSLVGRTVLAPGNAGALAAGGALAGAVDLPASTADVVVNITDSSGQLVQRLDLGAQSAGTARFAWNGITAAGTPAMPGVYKVSAQALNGTQQYAPNTLMEARVDSVSLGGANGLTLNLAGLGAVNLSDVKQIG
jgi:flagellar basal-body rod modification protein FlgD